MRKGIAMFRNKTLLGFVPKLYDFPEGGQKGSGSRACGNVGNSS